MTKSIGRMSQLIDGGASVLLVSHPLEHMLRFCSEAIWLERGQIVERGPALEVVKSYSQFIRVLEEQEAQGANRNGGAGAATSRGRRDARAAACARRPRRRKPATSARSGCSRTSASRTRSSWARPQDTRFLALGRPAADEHGSWSAPRSAEDGPFRTLTIGADGTASGAARFEVDGLALDSGHAFELVYRGGKTDVVEVDLCRTTASSSRNGLAATNGTLGAARASRCPQTTAARAAPTSRDGAQSGAGQHERGAGPAKARSSSTASSCSTPNRRASARSSTSARRSSFASSFQRAARGTLRRHPRRGAVPARRDPRGALHRRSCDARPAEGEQHEAVLRIPRSTSATTTTSSPSRSTRRSTSTMSSLRSTTTCSTGTTTSRSSERRRSLRGIFRHPADWTVA